MSLTQVCILETFSIALFKVLELLRRRTRDIDLDGPDRSNWLLGNITTLFEGGVDYCMHIMEKYGGAVRLYEPSGETIYVSDSRALLSKTSTSFKSPTSLPCQTNSCLAKA
ncbi:hypothetical protein EDB19DRAFT_1338239 [Suillus lakei]|nr:hypothetical protein EDB19DRAFT_1338239 [Suillus lakei]